MRTLLVVSPHLDDAVLSVGATLARETDRAQVYVATVFAGLPLNSVPQIYADDFHRQCGHSNGIEDITRRRLEDYEACRILDAIPLHLSFKDFIYRQTRALTWEEMRVALFPKDKMIPRDQMALVAQISKAVDDICASLDSDMILTCNGNGGHIDHLITRTATIRAVNGRTPVSLWKDVPYNITDGEKDGQDWTESLSNGAHYELKIRALASYESQLKMLFGNNKPWEEEQGRVLESESLLEAPKITFIHSIKADKGEIMKITLIIASMQGSTLGGADFHVLDLAKALTDAGNQVLVVSTPGAIALIKQNPESIV